MAWERVAKTGRFAKAKREECTEDSGVSLAGAAGSSEGLTKAPVETLGAPPRRLRQSYVRKQLAQAMPEITAVLIAKARTGSLGHMKMLVQLSGLDRGQLVAPVEKRKGKTLEQFLLEGWEREKENIGLGD